MASTLSQCVRSAAGSAASFAFTRVATSPGASATSKWSTAPSQVLTHAGMLSAPGIPARPRPRSAPSIVPIARSAVGTQTAFTSKANRPPA